MARGSEEVPSSVRPTDATSAEGLLDGARQQVEGLRHAEVVDHVQRRRPPPDLARGTVIRRLAQQDVGAPLLHHVAGKNISGGSRRARRPRQCEGSCRATCARRSGSHARCARASAPPGHPARGASGEQTPPALEPPGETNRCEARTRSTRPTRGPRKPRRPGGSVPTLFLSA